MTLSLRPYRPEDRAAAVYIFFRAVREGAAAFYDEAQRAAWAPSSEPDWTRADKLLDQWCWIAEREGRPVGFMSLDRTGYLDMAFVLPEEMGKVVEPIQGVTKQIIDVQQSLADNWFGFIRENDLLKIGAPVVEEKPAKKAAKK